MTVSLTVRHHFPLQTIAGNISPTLQFPTMNQVIAYLVCSHVFADRQCGPSFYEVSIQNVHVQLTESICRNCKATPGAWVSFYPILMWRRTSKWPFTVVWDASLSEIVVALVRKLLRNDAKVYLMNHNHMSISVNQLFPLNANPYYNAPVQAVATSCDASGGSTVAVSLLCGDSFASCSGQTKDCTIELVNQLCEDCGEDFPAGQPAHWYWATLTADHLLDWGEWNRNVKIMASDGVYREKITMRSRGLERVGAMFSSILDEVKPPRIILDGLTITTEEELYNSLAMYAIKSDVKGENAL